MTHRKLILLAFLLPTLAFGQKKYKFKYREHLTSQLSTFKTELEDTLLAADKCNLTFLISDNKGEAVPFANVKIKSSVIDTIVHSDFEGFITATLPPGPFSISVSALQFT